MRAGTGVRGRAGLGYRCPAFTWWLLQVGQTGWAELSPEVRRRQPCPRLLTPTADTQPLPVPLPNSSPLACMCFLPPLHPPLFFPVSPPPGIPGQMEGLTFSAHWQLKGSLPEEERVA